VAKEVPYARDIVCLAASRKTGGLCVAGKRLSARGSVEEWIRPVSGRTDGTLLHHAVRYGGGGQPAILDIIRIQFVRPQPHGHQVENQLVSAAVPWQRIGGFPKKRINELVDDASTLWLDGSSSAYGEYDTLTEVEAATVRSSLLFIAPDTLSLLVNLEYPGQEYQRKKVRARIRNRRTEYILAVTDPAYEEAYLRKEVGEYPLTAGEHRLCISLTEAFQGRCYKLVAAIIRV